MPVPTKQRSDREFVGAVVVLAALAAAMCSYDFVTLCSDVREFCVATSDVVFGDGKVRTCTPNFLSGVAPIGARVVACWLLLCCSLCPGRMFPTSTARR